MEDAREGKQENRLHKPAPNLCSTQNETPVKGKPRKVQLKNLFWFNDFGILQPSRQAGFKSLFCIRYGNTEAVTVLRVLQLTYKPHWEPSSVHYASLLLFKKPEKLQTFFPWLELIL